MADSTEDIQEMLTERRERLDAIESEIEQLEAEQSAVEEEITTLEQRLRDRGIGADAA